ncbi:GntR family transcriptional regulator [Ureibacillus composti]
MNAYEYIKEAIIHGNLEPGMRLAEESLAKEMSISRTPIREAIKQLESEGLVIPLKRGVKVRHFTEEDVKQIYDLRSLLEGYAASQAAIYRTQKHINEMEKANQLLENAIDRFIEKDLNYTNDIVNSNHYFHEAVIAASNNAHIQFHISKVVVLPLVFRSFHGYNHSQLRRSLEFHKTILTAIKNNEPERARISMQEHIYTGRDHVLEKMQKKINAVEEVLHDRNL